MDYKKWNKKQLMTGYTPLNMSHIHYKFVRVNYFTNPDLTSGNHQVYLNNIPKAAYREFN